MEEKPDAEKYIFKAEKIVMLPVDQIIPYKNNPKIHSDDQIKRIAKEIIRKGFDQPITVDGKNVIIKGHGRVLAAKALGWKTVPAIIRDDLTEKQANAMRIADNRLAESPWDKEILKDEIQGLDDGETNLEDETGFLEKELEAMFAPFGSGDPDFSPDDNEQPRLDQKAKVKCPKCGHEFEN